MNIEIEKADNGYIVKLIGRSSICYTIEDLFKLLLWIFEGKIRKIEIKSTELNS